MVGMGRQVLNGKVTVVSVIKKINDKSSFKRCCGFRNSQ